MKLKKKAVVFIDTNLYLRFYDTHSSEYKKYLKTLISFREYLIIPNQIVDEVYKNKLKVFIEGFKVFNSVSTEKLFMIPEHISNDVGIRDWNKRRKNYMTSLSEQKADFKLIRDLIIRKVAYSEDEISKEFELLFSSAIPESTEEINKARIRKEKGNPPGKKSDPLGDQLCWEQLLTVAADIDELWIFSSDSDYLTTVDDQCFLNPFLLKELKLINSNLKVKPFRELSVGISEFAKEIKNLEALPNDVDVKALKYEESTPLNDYKSIDLLNPFYSRAQPLFCEVCESETLHNNVHNLYLIGSGSIENAFTTQGFCSKCGSKTSVSLNKR